MSKIVKLEDLPAILDKPENQEKQVVQCHGVFDCCHVGHARHFEQSKHYGDILVVTVTSDRYVNKGEGRPIFNQNERAEMVSYLACVDYVAISDYPNASTAIHLIAPSFFGKGCDYFDKGVADPERMAVKDVEGMLVFTTTEKYSTTEIINRLKK